MGLNRDNIESLKKVMLKNAKRYDQSTFGIVDSDCGTRCCMAGFCRLIEVGEKQFNKEVEASKKKEEETHQHDDDFYDSCILSGKKFLGIENGEGEADTYLPDIFDFASFWPIEIRDEMSYASTNEDKVLVAFKALDRMDDTGGIE